ARTTHRRGRSGRHENPAGTPPARHVARHRQPLASCPSRPSFVIFVLWREQMITRRPHSHTATRRARPVQHPRSTRRQPGRLNGKLNGGIRYYFVTSQPYVARRRYHPVTPSPVDRCDGATGTLAANHAYRTESILALRRPERKAEAG